ncbi:MAG: alpha/beta hydrolase [Ardenticatenaceae bacterium]|nr:alpha/beta hydrolase [Ardenticatenaceae bacterium]
MSERERGPHQGQKVVHAGRPLGEAQAAVILVHGRGASAESILDLGRALYDERLAYLAPQAAGHTWYPHSFLSPISANEPGISSGLQVVADLVKEVEADGIPAEKIIVGGFSQGACLASEFVVRHPRRYGGLLAFSGGVIGPLGMNRNDRGDLNGTPAFLGCSDVDFHIPVERVHETDTILQNLGGVVNKQIYAGMGHTIIQEEIDEAMKIVTDLFQ